MVTGKGAPIRHCPSADNRHLTICRLLPDADYYKNLILLSYLSYLFRLRLLSEDSYLLEGLQDADKTKTHPKVKLQNAPTFAGNGNHSHVCLLLIIKIKTCTYPLCKRHPAYTNVLISPYRLSAKWPIIGQ